MKTLRMIINPFTGTAKLQKPMCRILKLFNMAGYETVVYFTRSKGDARRYAALYGKETDLLVVCGGDGTLNETVSGLLQLEKGERPPIGYIPAGTCNDVASSLGLSMDAYRAAEKIVSGKPSPLDVGDFAGRQFLYVASFGAFTEASYSTPQKMKNTLGHFAYVLSGVNSLKAVKPYHAAFESQHGRREDEYIFCSISNSTSIAGIVKLDKKLVNLADGVFEVTLVRNPQNLNQLMDIARAVLDHSLKSEFIEMFHTDHITFSSGEEIHWTLDGEHDPGGAQIEINNIHHAVEVIV